jgi:hypothetical protein
MDLVDAFKEIGLRDAGSEARPADDPIVSARSRDAVAPNLEQLHHSFIVSRGRSPRAPLAE